MFANKFLNSTLLLVVATLPCSAQEKPKSESKSKSKSAPIELEVIKSCIGVWDAEIEVWPQGLKAESIKFKGVETNRAYGKYWLSSDFDSEFMGQTMKIHSIVGYDLSKKKMFGLIVDHGPYSATMTGEYDKKSNTITWMTEAKTADGKRMVQKTVVTQKSPKERVLVLKVPGKKKDEFTKMMQIRFVKRK